MIWIIGIVLAIALPILAIAIVYFWLAMANLFWTFIQEGYVKLRGKGEAFDRPLISFRGHTFDDDWNVVPENVPVKDGKVVPEGTPGAKIYKEPKHLFGGLRFYGIYPIWHIMTYTFEWAHLHSNSKVAYHKEDLDKVLLKEELYVVEHKLETDPVEDMFGVPLGVSWIMPIKIVNPPEAIFVYRRWLVMINGVTAALLKNFMARYSYFDDLIDMVAGVDIKDRQEKKGITNEKITADEGDFLRNLFWKELIWKLQEKAEAEGAAISTGKNGGKLPATIRVFGVEIQRRGCEQLKIDPDPEYRKLTTLAYEAEQRKKARVIEAKAEREAWAQETTGTIISTITETTGETEKEVRKRILESDELQEKFFEVGVDLVERQLALKHGAFMDIRVGGPGAEGFQGAIAPLITLFKNLGNQEKGEDTEKKTRRRR